MVGNNISKSLQKKIITHRYVDFHELLPNDDTSEYTLQFQPNSQPAPFQLVRNKKDPINRSQWLAAWDEYMAIYIQKHPKHIAQMMTYAKTIRSMMASNYDWRSYDETFRRRRELADNNNSASSWVELKLDAYLEAMKKPGGEFREAKRGARKSASVEGRNLVPPSYCYDYHNRFSFCENHNCTYLHQCPTKNCQGNHPIYMCRKTQARKNYSNTQDHRHQHQLRGRSQSRNFSNSRGNQNRARPNKSFAQNPPHTDKAQ